MAEHENVPTLKVMPLRGKSGWYILVTWPNGQSEEIGDFRSIIEAEAWKIKEAAVWVSARMIARNT
jgi:hypothetical protein